MRYIVTLSPIVRYVRVRCLFGEKKRSYILRIFALMVNLGKEGGGGAVRRWSRVRRSLEDPKESSKWMMIVAVGVVGVCAAGYWWWSSRSGRGDGDDSEDGDLTKPKG